MSVSGAERATDARSSTPALALGVVLSVALHVGAVAVLMRSASQRAGASDSMPAWNTPEPDAPRDRDILAGIERSSAVTINWVGFETPTLHEAQETEVEQSALSPAPGSPGSTASPTPPATVSAVQPAEITPPVPQTMVPIVPVNPASDLLLRERPDPAVALLAPSVPVPDRLPVPRSDDRTDATKDVRAVRAPTQPTPADYEETAADPESSVKPASAENVPQVEAPQQTDESADPVPQSPAAPPVDPGNDGTPGQPSESEADASAKTAPLRIRPGQVVARQGLEIITVRPRFRHTVDLTAPYNNPVVRVLFDRTGVVRDASFVREGTTLRNTGSTERDGPVLDAVFRWRAKGAALTALDPDAPDARVEFVVELLIR